MARANIAYNVIFTKKWIAIIPRTHAASKDGSFTNGAGMLGLVWVDQEERDE
jgi:ATP adenylyltransferase/5',5'''-P-1,P-4-tetraphosphate phosphorylase II